MLTMMPKTEVALLDSGATENFLDPRMVNKFRLPTQKLQKPRSILNIDGTHNKAGSITRKCQLEVQFGDVITNIDFYITDLGQDRAVLGFPFFQKFNPIIDWQKGTIAQGTKVWIKPTQIWEHRYRVWCLDHKILARADLLQKTNFAQQWATTANKNKQQLKEEDVLVHYQIHHKVFSEEEAKRLPPSCQEDMVIDLKEGVPEQLDCKVYPLMAKEINVLRETLASDLAKGYISHGTSSYVSPIFFIPKKDGKELWMAIDYRKLNDVTKKDFYPLPNLWTELEKLSQHRLFSKFDVRAGYNNIRIREKDQTKAAFKTPLGTFVPTVMTFGFCNAPSIFQ